MPVREGEESSHLSPHGPQGCPEGAEELALAALSSETVELRGEGSQSGVFCAQMLHMEAPAQAKKTTAWWRVCWGWGRGGSLRHVGGGAGGGGAGRTGALVRREVQRQPRAGLAMTGHAGWATGRRQSWGDRHPSPGGQPTGAPKDNLPSEVPDNVFHCHLEEVAGGAGSSSQRQKQSGREGYWWSHL